MSEIRELLDIQIKLEDEIKAKTRKMKRLKKQSQEFLKSGAREGESSLVACKRSVQQECAADRLGMELWSLRKRVHDIKQHLIRMAVVCP